MPCRDAKPANRVYEEAERVRGRARRVCSKRHVHGPVDARVPRAQRPNKQVVRGVRCVAHGQQAAFIPLVSSIRGAEHIVCLTACCCSRPRLRSRQRQRSQSECHARR